MQVEIVNVVGAAMLDRGIDLKKLIREYSNVYFPSPDFPGVVIRFKGQKAPTILAFNTGKLIATGGKSTEQVSYYVRRVVKLLREVGFKVRLEKFEIVNIVATGSLGKPVELERVYMRLPRSIYEPEQFPGVIFSLNSCKALLFSRGSFVLTGLKSEGEVEKAAKRLKRVVRRALEAS